MKEGKFQESLVKKHIYFIIFITFLFLLVSCNQNKTEWKGTIMEVDGVTIVKNPKEPMYTEDVFSLEEELSIGEADGPEEYLFSRLSNLTVDDRGYIYALDSREKHIKVYNDEGKYIATMGKEGQGPGDLLGPNNVCITAQNEVMVPDSSNNRLTFFSLEGKFIRSITTTPLELLETKIDSNGDIIGLDIVREEENPRHELKKFNADLQYLCSFDSSPLQNPRNLNPFMGGLKWDVDKNDRVVCGYPITYEIKIFDPEGNIEKKIEKDYEPLEITKEDIKRGEELLYPGVKVSMPKYYPAFRDFIIDDECRIFVQTWEKVPDGDERYYNVFDEEGKYIAKIPLGARTQLIKKNKLYAIEADDDGYHCIKRYKVTWNY